jgi:cytochrome c oxidase subunit 4
MTGPMETPRTYMGVFAALIALTGLTVFLARYDLGSWHGAVGLIIAGMKAALIVAVFMHAWRSSRMIGVIIIAALFWLILLLALTLTDFLTRDLSLYP